MRHLAPAHAGHRNPLERSFLWRREQPNQPTHRAYSVIRREGRDDFWLKVGLAFPHKDGAGFNIASNFPAGIMPVWMVTAAIGMANTLEFPHLKHRRSRIYGRCLSEKGRACDQIRINPRDADARPTPVSQTAAVRGIVKDAKSSQIEMETAAIWGIARVTMWWSAKYPIFAILLYPVLVLVGTAWIYFYGNIYAMRFEHFVPQGTVSTTYYLLFCVAQGENNRWMLARTRGIRGSSVRFGFFVDSLVRQPTFLVSCGSYRTAMIRAGLQQSAYMSLAGS